MKVIKEGHTYELMQLDLTPGAPPQVLSFVCREPHLGIQPGTQTQDVLRMVVAHLQHTANAVGELMEVLMDRTDHCDGCMAWEGNQRIIKALSESARQARLALLYHEHRALERKFERGELDPAATPTGPDGHFRLT